MRSFQVPFISTVRDLRNEVYMPEPKLYIEDPSHKLIPAFLDDEIYAKASTGFVILCADMIFLNRSTRTFLMAKRSVYALKAFWTFGGRVRVGETDRQALQRTGKAETGLVIAPDRLTYVTQHRVWCSKRKQEPQDVGGDYMCHVYAFEPSDDELRVARQNLSAKEYELDLNPRIQVFDRQRLVKEGVWQTMIDLYDKIYPGA